MSDLEHEHLRLLMLIRSRTRMIAQEYDERLEDFVAALLESGSSLTRIAEACDVGTSTVQNSSTNAAVRRTDG